MPRLNWSIPGQRYYEIGCDRGVLYVGTSAGVPWTGLVSVVESPNGGDPLPFYLDGRKYLNLSAHEEFEATLNAFTAPKEFLPCDGTAQIQNGLYATQQPRKQFGLSYRTGVGNDTEGQEHGYKIHLVYNALAAPASLSRNTLSDNVDPITMSWALSTLPPTMSGIKPTAHLIIDSRYTNPTVLAAVEDILYGSTVLTASLPSYADLVAIFTP